jgi:hypothetical protein
VATPSEELGAIVSRLEEAAARLKQDAGPPPERERSDAPLQPRADRTPPPERRRLGEVLDGLERANVEVRRARARLAELEARLVRDAA